MRKHSTLGTRPRVATALCALVAAAALLCGVAVTTGNAGTPPLEQAERPNFVVILVDDLGWADLEPYSSRFYDTPHLNRLARQSMSFTHAYAASPVCSPTRASLLTGQYPARLRITDWLPGQGDQPSQRLLQVRDRAHLPLGEVTVAEVLREAGYRTGYVGKWHLGRRPDHLPTDQGFDTNVAGYYRGSPARFGGYFSPWNNPRLRVTAEGQYLPDRLGREAVDFIEESAMGESDADAQPFFLQLAFYAVHTPLQAPEALVAKYRTRADTLLLGPELIAGREHGSRARIVQSNPVYAAMVEAMDRNVGRVIGALEAQGVAGETVILLLSDNGGLAAFDREGIPPTSNRPLRAGKGWLYEGGVRVPMMVRWPGVAEPERVSRAPVNSIDVFPTMLDIAGIAVPEQAQVDGESLAPILRGESDTLQREALYWHYPHYHISGMQPGGAIRKGRYKLIEYFEDGEAELYDLQADLAEANDLLQEHPEKARALQRQLRQWRQSVDAQMPGPNPDYTIGE